MAESFNKKEREKKRKKRKKDKLERKLEKKKLGIKPPEFTYIDENGNFTTEPPDPNKREKIKAEDIQISTPKGNRVNTPLRRRGFVKFINEAKKFGFVKDSITNAEFYFQTDRLDIDLREHDKITFDTIKGPKGKIAVNIELS